MFPLLLNPLPVLLTLSTTFGVLVHDLHLDQVTSVATVPAIVAVAGVGFIDPNLKWNEHVHPEKSSVRINGSQPRVQPRSEDKKYVSHKKYTSNAYSSDYSWPSE